MSRKRLILSLAAVGWMLLPSGAFADSAPHTGVQLVPIQLGTSGSTQAPLFGGICFAGTLGGLVEDAGGTPYILSNNHVLAQTNTLSTGEPIIHPALLDGVCSGAESPTTVATLSSFVDIKFCKSAGPFINCKVNTVDAAIAAAVVGEVDPDGAILDIGLLALAPVSATLNMVVQKSGRTTGNTVGAVSAVDVDVIVCYANPCDDPGNLALFVNQVGVNGSFSAAGDSGSVIVECADVDGVAGCDDTPGLVGLLFAGGTNVTFFNRFENVQSALGVAPVGCGVACFGEEDGGSPNNGRGPGGNGPPGQNNSAGPGLERASEVKAQHADELLQHRGVVGTGIAVDDLGDPVIVVYVKDATGEPDNPIPSELEGIPVSVVVTGQIRAF